MLKRKTAVLILALLLTAVLAAPAGAAESDTTTFSGEVGAAPTIISVSPASGDVGNTVQVTITGTGFVVDNTTVDAGAGITVENVIVTGPTSITADFTIAAGAAAGERDVTVTAAGQKSTVNANSKFTVNAYITVNAPEDVSLGVLTVGGTNTGSVELYDDPLYTLVDTNATAWTVTVKDLSNDGFLKNGSGNPLSVGAEPFKISKQSTTEGLTSAATGISYINTDTDPVLYWSQAVPTDAAAGTYTITLTFTGSLP